MKRTLVAAVSGLALAVPLSLGLAAPASAAPAAQGACAQAGLDTLKSLGALQAAAKGQVDYSAFGTGPGGAGLIRAALPGGSFLSLGEVVKLHTSNPELFAWCD